MTHDAIFPLDLHLHPRDCLARLLERPDDHARPVCLETKSRLQLVEGNAVELPAALVTERPSQHERQEIVRPDFLHREEPRIVGKSFDIGRGEMQFQPVLRTVFSSQNVQSFQRMKSLVKGAVEGRAGVFPQQFGETPPVEFHDSGFHPARKNVPSQPEERLQSYQTESVRGPVLGGIGQIEPEDSGNGCPFLNPDGSRGGYGDSSGMLLLVALGAESDAFDSVVLMHGQDVIEDFRDVAVEVPQSQKDVVEGHDVVAFQFVVRVAPETPRGPIPPHPVLIDLGGTDSPFKLFQLLRKVHAGLYTGRRTCSDEMWDLQ